MKLCQVGFLRTTQGTLKNIDTHIYRYRFPGVILGNPNSVDLELYCRLCLFIYAIRRENLIA